MSRNKKIVIWVVSVVAGLAVLVFGGALVYVNFIKDDAPKKFDESSLDSVLGATTTVAPGDPVTTTAGGGDRRRPRVRRPPPSLPAERLPTVIRRAPGTCRRTRWSATG